MKMKEVSKVERPREKVLRYGVKKMDDSELLALLLGSGIKGKNVVELSKAIIKLIKKTGVENLTVEKLTSIKGLGSVKATQVIAALELGRRLHGKEPEFILTPQKVFDLCADVRDSRREHFLVFYLSSRNSLIAKEVVSIGTLDSSLVHPREVFEPALRHSAASVVLAHNHPSGDPTPSDEDIKITEDLREAARLLGIEIFDHIIVTKGNFLSFKERKVVFA